MLDKKHLEIILSKLKPIESPKEYFEQYTTPSNIVAHILNLANLNGDIKNKKVIDFGCGSGVFSIGASLLGAKEVIGIDVDADVIDIAKTNADELDLDIEFLCEDVRKFSGECDTVVQNPPFGMRGERHMDAIFIEKALECADTVYTLHRGGYDNDGVNKSRDFLRSFIQNKGAEISQIKEYKFDTPYMFKFHKKPRVTYNVDLYIINK